MNKVLQSIDAHFPQSPEAKKKRRDLIYKPIAATALLGIAFSTAAAVGNGLRIVDEATQKTVDSVTETMGQNEDYITLAKRAVISLGLSPDDYSETDIGNNVETDSNPKAGQQVTFDEVRHWYGTTSVVGRTEDTDK